MKIKELREKNENELQNLLKESRDKLRQLRFDLVSKQQKNVKEISQLKKDIARILTLFRQKASEGKPQKNN
jgi:large subunit ribosomal protein L29